MNSVPVSGLAVAVMVAVPAARKLAVPDDVMFTTEALLELQVGTVVAPLALKVALPPTWYTTSGKFPTTCSGQGVMVSPVVTVAVAVPLTPL